MANSCSLPNPDKCGNMYFRSTWEFCPEYKVGDVVLHNGALYLALRDHAGKDPKDNPDYWQCFGMGRPPEPVPMGRIILDGGYASTSAEEIYDGRTVDGGTSSDRIYKPLL